MSVSSAADDKALMKVLIILGSPGHSSVYLERNGQQLYWDPGGYYGTELEECYKYGSEYDPNSACRRFFGFPWERLLESRDRDLFMGDAADLMRVISIYHLDGDVRSQVHTFHLTGKQAERAWGLLAEGLDPESTEEFDTDRNPLFCAKGVTDFLSELGGQFADFPSLWFPEELGEAMAEIGSKPSQIYTLDHPDIQQYIAKVRSKAGRNALPLSLSLSLSEQQSAGLGSKLETKKRDSGGRSPKKMK